MVAGSDSDMITVEYLSDIMRVDAGERERDHTDSAIVILSGSEGSLAH